MPTMVLLQQFIGLLLISLANGDDCPIVFNPPEVVVEYGASFSVNCSTDTEFGLRWESKEETVENAREISKTVDALMDWESNVTCYIYFNDTHTCSLDLPVTIYKTPDSVSIKTVNHTGGMIEGNHYELQCDIYNVAPAHNLTVNWYKGETLVNQTSFNDTIKSPVNKTATLQIHPDRYDDGAQFRCEAELKLGEEGPQHPPTVTSDPLNLTVQYHCPLFFNPPHVVAEYGASFSVNCSTNTTFGLSWEPNEETVESTGEISKTVDAPMDWESKLTCYIYFIATQKCSLDVPVTIYKTPDSVSISAANHITPMIEGNQYELQCDIYNVAPVQNLTVNWYKGETLVNQTSFNDTIKSPVNKTTTLLIHPNRYDEGAQFRCEAELQLGEEGPQPPPKVTSDSLNIPVEYHCPLFFNPPHVVAEYGASFSVNCSTNTTFGLSWEPNEETVESTGEISKTVDAPMDWESKLTCYIYFIATQKCSLDVPVTIYKTPDSVSISAANHIRPMIEGNQYELQCDIYNVAPVQNLTVNWYKGETLVNQTSFTDTIKSPVNKTTTLLIHPNRYDEGAQFRCEAELQLGEEGPQPPPKVTSDSLNIPVEYESCPIRINPKRAVVKYGSDVSAECKALVPHDGMGWESTLGAVPLSKAEVSTWSVSNFRDWHLEPPFCFINYDGPQCTADLPLTIYKTPDSVSISAVNHPGPLIEGNQYELLCNIHDVAPVQKLTVNWYKGKTLMNQTSFTDTIKSSVNKTATFLIHPNRYDDGAQFRCEAELQLGEDGPQPPPKVTSDPLKITVHYPPEIKFCLPWSPKKGMSLVSYPNSNSVVGNPHPRISWKWKSLPINSSAPLTKYDSGLYEITASNTYGNSSCTTNITVEYSPELKCSKSYEVKEETVFNHCVTDGLPKPEFSLVKDGKMFQHPYFLKWNDSGLYRLTAKNKHGAVNNSFAINVLHAPRFYDSQEHFVVADDKNIALQCISSGNPEADMLWSFKNKTISTGRRNITLYIERATSTNAGVYTCSATNKFGRQDKIFTVEMRENSRSYLSVIILGLLILFILICLLIFFWRWRRSSGHYDVKPLEMRPLNNGSSM